jgi:hypothetical protein
MAREMERLTPAKVRHATAGLPPDGGGLYLQVTVSKKTAKLNKSWLFRFALSGRERKMELGLMQDVWLGRCP